jgi:two-component system sensor histidine kinase/response regulator
MMGGKFKVLYIDDEPNNLVGFKASFRRDYEIVTAQSPARALIQLQAHPDVAVIISDQRMPDKTGVEFFEEIQTRYPAPVRMLCTGYTDVRAVIAAINKGHVFRYIQKPWNEDDMRSAIEEGYNYYIATSLLSEKNAELLKANTELDKFAYSVTHDLRSPILSVLGAINIAKAAKSTYEVHEMLDMMAQSMVKLDGFIHNIHDYYTIKRGELNITEVNIPELIENLKGIYNLDGVTNNINFQVTTDIRGPFYSDPIVLYIILNNLLSNAFKYQKRASEYKFVRLLVQVIDNQMLIEVEDNGIGIHEHYLDSIFDMFYRATSEGFGSGFGLYNVKDALDKLNGGISVSSQKNEGALFKINIQGK